MISVSVSADTLATGEVTDSGTYRPSHTTIKTIQRTQ